VTGIEVQLEAKDYALGIFLDKEAFDSTSNKSKMTKYEIPEALVNWTQDILIDCQLRETNRFSPLVFLLYYVPSDEQNTPIETERSGFFDLWLCR